MTTISAKIIADSVSPDEIRLTPCGHQATPDTRKFDKDECWEFPWEHGNFKGWRQYRRMLPGGIV